MVPGSRCLWATKELDLDVSVGDDTALVCSIVTVLGTNVVMAEMEVEVEVEVERETDEELELEEEDKEVELEVKVISRVDEVEDMVD
ncbi:hypothetical protein GYMLUDRAFT_35222 [Collybiopsis luxurians FD-317 M1]|nr:hypothetical protein GYMLUDRAFT_35222 [Collybiopsis luxurians FD-317 M1]